MPGSSRPHEQAAEGQMSNAQQAFLFTGGLFVASFATIYLIWLVDRLLRGLRR